MGKSKQAYVRVAPDHNGLHGPETAHQCPDCVRYELKMIKAESPEAVAARAAYAKGWAAAMEAAAKRVGEFFAEARDADGGTIRLNAVLLAGDIAKMKPEGVP